MANKFAEDAKKRLLGNLPPCFFDPLTGSQPTSEEQLSGLLGLFHQLGRVAWNEVPLWLPTNAPSASMADGLLGETTVCAEYQLFWTCDQDKNDWGQMRADLLFLSRDGRSVCILENKIGSDFTYKNDPLRQLNRQLAFLSKCKALRRFLVLISGAEFFNKPWYCNELEDALRPGDNAADLTGYLIRWEDVFKALR